jgi:thiamine kinase-like enzyme
MYKRKSSDTTATVYNDPEGTILGHAKYQEPINSVSDKTQIVSVNVNKLKFFKFPKLEQVFSDDNMKILNYFLLSRSGCPPVSNCTSKKSPDSAQAEITFQCSKRNKDKIERVVRKAPVSKQDDTYLTNWSRVNTMNDNAITNTIVSEVICLSLCNSLQRICPHFVLTKELYICENKQTFKNKVYDKWVYMISDYVSGGTLFEYLAKLQPQFTKDTVSLSFNYKQLHSICFQVLVALYALQSQFNIVHFDLHHKNVLLKKTSKTYIEYIIEGVHYKVPTYGYICKIIDFGMARIPKFLERENILDSGDYYNIPVLTQRAKVADQRRFAYSLLKVIFPHNQIDLTISYANNSKQGYFYKSNSNSYITNEQQFSEYIKQYFTYVNDLFSGTTSQLIGVDYNITSKQTSDFLTLNHIMEAMLNGTSISAIFKKNFTHFQTSTRYNTKSLILTTTSLLKPRSDDNVKKITRAIPKNVFVVDKKAKVAETMKSLLRML